MVRIIDREIVDPILQNRFNSLCTTLRNVVNTATLVSRQSTRGTTTDPRRSVDDECGYISTAQLTLDDYQEKYDRNPIAKKLVDILPNHCWQKSPIVYESEDEGEETAFEVAVNSLDSSLQEENWYQDSNCSPLWNYLYRLDKVSGIGHYGVMLLGVDGADGKDLRQPLAYRAGRKLIYLKVFPQVSAPIKSFDDDPSSPRYRLPKDYYLSFDDIYSGMHVTADSAVQPISAAVEVHWTRVIHYTDDVLSNEYMHIPRMRPVFNNLENLYKLYGSSTEMYWQGAFPGVSWETHPQLGGDVVIDMAAFKAQIEQFMNSLQRHVATTGMHANQLSTQVSDPTPQINANLEAVCMSIDCPKRIFMGSERGELASSQDAGAWNSVVDGRRDRVLTPRLIIPVFNRMISVGILPKPKGYSVKWPERDLASSQEKADRATKLTQAIAAYVAGGCEQIMPLDMFLTLVLGFTTEEGASIIEAIEAEGIRAAQQELKEKQLQQQIKTASQPQSPTPVKVKDGETLVDPQSGKKLPFAENYNRQPRDNHGPVA